MDQKDIVAFGSAKAYFMAEEDKNAEYMIPLNRKDRGTPYRPVGPSQGVRRGAMWEGASEFIRRSEERCRRLT